MGRNSNETTRKRIVDAARELLLEHGIEGTSTAAICRAAGVSNGSMFHHFTSKEGLVFAVYSEIRAEYWDSIINAMVAESDPLLGIEQAVKAAFRFLCQQPDAAAFLLDATGKKWIEAFADEAEPQFRAGIARSMAWAGEHIAAGRILGASPDSFIALVAGAPQWIGQISRVRMASAPLDVIGDELAMMVRRAFTPGP